MARQAIDFSTPHSELFGGGSIFTQGLYRVEESDFRLYDFKRPGNDSLCAYMKLQPLDSDGADSGDAVERYWPLNAKSQNGDVYVEGITPVKGRKGAFSQITLTEKSFGKLSGKSDFMYLHQSCEKAEVDLDSIGNDFTAFEGQVFEFGIVNKEAAPKTAVEAAEEGEGGEAKKNYPKQVVIVVGLGPKKGKKAAKPAKEEEEEEDEKPVKKAAKKKVTEPETAEEWLAAYLADQVCTDDNADEEVGHMDHKLNVPKWLNKREVEPAMLKKVMALYNDVEDGLSPVLDTLGWTYNAKKKVMVKQ